MTLYHCQDCGARQDFTGVGPGLGIPLCSCGAPPCSWHPLFVRSWFVPISQAPLVQGNPSAALAILSHRVSAIGEGL